MTLIFRSPVDGDVDELAALAAQTFPLACPPDMPHDAIQAYIRDNLTSDHFVRYSRDDRRDILVADEVGRLAGYSMTVFDSVPDQKVRDLVGPGTVIELNKFYMLPVEQGRGSASRLMAATLAVARQRPARAIWLSVNQANARANRFYEKCGFEMLGTRAAVMGGSAQVDLIRALPLGAKRPNDSDA